MSARVIAIIVTFNRKALLLRALDAVFAQTRVPDRVLVIDNDSSDGTPDALAAAGWLDEPRLEHRRLDTNTGSAGGLDAGMAAAQAQGADWLWMMDDDGQPLPDCLAQLLAACDRGRLDAANALVLSDTDAARLSFDLGGLDTDAGARAAADAQGLIHGVINPFNGTLLSADALRRAGPVKAEMFIWGDEAEYMLRLAACGLRFATVVDARYRHPATRSEYPSFLFGRLRIERRPRHLEPNLFRNMGYMLRTYHGRLGLRYVAKYCLYFATRREPRAMLRFLRYYVDGWSGRYRLPPLG